MIIYDTKPSYKIQLSEHMELEKNGNYLVCKDATLGRCGVMQYTKKELGLSNSNELVNVYRMEEDLFDKDSLSSLEGRPLTLTHPNELVTSSNYQKYAKGEVFNVRRDGNNIIGDIRVCDKECIDLILNKKMRELSLGLENNLVKDEQKGIYKFVNIIYNHLALVFKGRAKTAMICDSEKGEEDMEKVQNEQLDKLTQAFSSLEETIKNFKPKVVETKVEGINDTPPIVNHTVEMNGYFEKMHRDNYNSQEEYLKGIYDLCNNKDYKSLYIEKMSKK